MQVANKQPQALGEILTFSALGTPAPGFIGPVDVLLGENDYVSCSGDCTYPNDQSKLFAPAFFPNAGNGSQHYLVPGTGHVINAHYAAPLAFAQMINFLRTNGF